MKTRTSCPCVHPVAAGPRPRQLLGASAVALLLAMALAACGGGAGAPPPGGGGPSERADGSTAATATATGTAPGVNSGGEEPGANVATVRVDGGIDGRQINSAYVSVTVCSPGSSTACQTIDHVLVDTGSSGLRLASSALNMALPAATAPDGGQLGECAMFAGGFSWGSVRKADIRIAGKVAAGIPIQVVNDAATALPDACRHKGIEVGLPPGSNGILGVGMRVSDCGAPCEHDTSPDTYFSCRAPGSCTSSTAPLASQVSNPVAFFASDNNGVALRLPPVPPGGAGAIEGQLIFGIGTQANNQLGSSTIVRAGAATGLMWTLYKGVSYPSLIDSGSNAVFLADTTIPTCGGDWFCPSQPVRISARMIEPVHDPQSIAVEFTVESEQHIGPATSAANIGASSADRPGWYFVWGLPFHFGRTVFTAIDGARTPAGPGPFWAF